MRGLPKLRVPRKTPPVGLALPRANRARDKATQRVASSWHFLGAHRGDPTSSSFVSKSRPRGFFHTPLCWLASSRLGFHDRDYPGTLLKTTWPRFTRGGIRPCMILWRGTCPCWLSPMHGDPGSTKIQTQHCGAKSQIASQLTISGTTMTRQVPIV
jgi:hypothetical protein